MDFHQNWHRRKKPKSKKTSSLGVNWLTSPREPPFLGEEVLKIHANNDNNPITALSVRKSLKFLRSREIWVEEHDGDVRFYTGSGNTAVSRMRSEKYAVCL